MILALLILSIALARYQYLAEDSVVNVLTLPKSEALQYISSSYEPSYIVTKQRHKFVLIISLIVRYNCTDVYHYHDKSKEENQFIVVAKDLRTLGICGGQTNRVGALEIALNRVCDSPKGAIVASDGFFPAIDNIQVMAQDRISGVIQPGGSIKDKDVIEMANKYEISMITTGIRHFKH